MKQRIIGILAWSVLMMLICGTISAQSLHNPILPGFNPDPSICRVGEDYYLVTSSFTWFPGLPIYHSRDLVNWELIGHGISRTGELHLNGVDDNNGIWAPTIRYHSGVFYIITTAYESGGTFYITAKDPKGPWSDPVWLKGIPGIDPSLFWDDNGKCYYVGNRWNGNWEKSWPGQVAIWLQEINLKQRKLIGKDQILTFGHASNAAYAEGPHIYEIGGKYLLLMAEGGSGLNRYHAVTAHHSDSLFQNFTADQINPVLTHRQLGKDYPIQNVGHADLVQTQNGDWYAVVLGNRVVEGQSSLGRETFLCKVDFEGGTPIFNKGFGRVLMEQQRPDLPWTPVKKLPERQYFNDSDSMTGWYSVRTPDKPHFRVKDGKLELSLEPYTLDALVSSSMLLKKVMHLNYSVLTKLKFIARSVNEQAGIVLYRTSNGYYSLLKGQSDVQLIKMDKGKREILACVQYSSSEIFLGITVNGVKGQFSFGTSLDKMVNIGKAQILNAISDNKYNKFTGTGVGVYSTSNGSISHNVVLYDWFEYKGK